LHMHSFMFQMKQFLEQVKCKANDFKVSCLLSITNRGAIVCVRLLLVTW